MKHNNRIGLLVILSALISGCFAQPTPVVFPSAIPTVVPTITTVVETAIPTLPNTAESISTAILEVSPTVPAVKIDFKNELYLLEGSTDPVQLIDGKYENSEDLITLILSEFSLEADLDQDGDLDGAALLSLNTGGSGIFTMLSILLNEDGKFTSLYPSIIDDRVKQIGLSFENNTIRVDYLTREEDQPMTDDPSVPLSRYFTVSEGEIIEVDENGMDLVQSFAVSGTISYLQRISLQPEADISIKLVDISKADSPAVLLEELSFTADGEQPPYQFVLPYNPDVIDPEATVVVEAKITLNGKVIFASTKIYPVVTKGNPSNVEIILEQVK